MSCHGKYRMTAFRCLGRAATDKDDERKAVARSAQNSGLTQYCAQFLNCAQFLIFRYFAQLPIFRLSLALESARAHQPRTD